MKKLLSILLFFTCLFAVSCNKNDSYSKLMNSQLSGEDLLFQLNLFEKEHTEDFRSKIDLANYYIVIGDYTKCYEYLLRAESVIKNCPKGDEGNKYKTLMYGMRAQVELYSKDYEKAHSYVDKAISVSKSENRKYNYLKAQIYVAQNDNDNALKLYDETYKAIPELITTEDEQAYMYLLASSERFEECKVILEDYLNSGNYFYGLGSFASGVYENLNEVEKAVLMAYVDYEYFSAFNGMNKDKFITNLDKILMGQPSAEKMFKLQGVIDLIKSRVDEKIVASYNSDFYPAQFISFINKIRDNNFTEYDVQSYLDLEKYFALFPSYYWNAWCGFCQVDSNQKGSYVPLLNKIILFGDNIYVAQARKELGSLVGLSESDAGWILLPGEVERLLVEFDRTSNQELLEPLYKLLSLKDNTYELNALSVLKSHKDNVALNNEILKKITSSDGRLKERLQYIIQ